jgi:hypothetical protein
MVQEVMDPPKNSIDGFVVVPVLPPAFHNASVVSMDKDIVANAWQRGKHIDRKLKANGFSPSNISLSIEGLPAWY